MAPHCARLLPPLSDDRLRLSRPARAIPAADRPGDRRDSKRRIRVAAPARPTCVDTRGFLASRAGSRAEAVRPVAASPILDGEMRQEAVGATAGSATVAGGNA